MIYPSRMRLLPRPKGYVPEVGESSTSKIEIDKVATTATSKLKRQRTIVKSISGVEIDLSKFQLVPQDEAFKIIKSGLKDPKASRRGRLSNGWWLFSNLPGEMTKRCAIRADSSLYRLSQKELRVDDATYTKFTLCGWVDARS